MITIYTVKVNSLSHFIHLYKYFVCITVLPSDKYVIWIFVNPLKLGYTKRAPNDKKFKFKTCFSTLCPIQITFVEKVRIEMFYKNWLHFIKNHKTTAVSFPNKVFTRKKSLFIFSYTQIEEFLFCRCFVVNGSRQFWCVRAPGQQGRCLTSEVAEARSWPRSRSRPRSRPRGRAPAASRWESLKEITLFQTEIKLKRIKYGKSKTF